MEPKFYCFGTKSRHAQRTHTDKKNYNHSPSSFVIVPRLKITQSNAYYTKSFIISFHWAIELKCVMQQKERPKEKKSK